MYESGTAPSKVDASARVVAAVSSMRHTTRETSPENLKPILEAFPIEHGSDPDRSPAVGTPAERLSRPRTGICRTAANGRPGRAAVRKKKA